MLAPSCGTSRKGTVSVRPNVPNLSPPARRRSRGLGYPDRLDLYVSCLPYRDNTWHSGSGTEADWIAGGGYLPVLGSHRTSEGATVRA